MNRVLQYARKIVSMLVRKNYLELAELTNGKKLSADLIEGAIVDYGRHLVEPPEFEFSELLDIVAISDSDPQEWSVMVPLWTEEEGRSDLAINLTLTDLGTDFAAQINGIYVP